MKKVNVLGIPFYRFYYDKNKIDDIVKKLEKLSYTQRINSNFSDRKSTRLNSSHVSESRMPSSA